MIVQEFIEKLKDSLFLMVSLSRRRRGHRARLEMIQVFFSALHCSVIVTQGATHLDSKFVKKHQ